MLKKLSIAGLALVLSATSSFAATQITWWHGMSGHNGDVINEISKRFNASQTACELTPVSKGTYEEALPPASPLSVRTSSRISFRFSTPVLQRSSTPRALSFRPKT